MSDPLRAHRQAALTYAGLGLLVIVITFAAGLVPSSRRGAIWELAIGAAFIVLFAVVMYLQPRVEIESRRIRIIIRSWWLLSAALVASNAWRAVTYFNDGLGWHVEILPFSVTRMQARPVAFVNAALMAAIVVMLVRSAWTGFSAWRARRLMLS